MCSPTPDGSQHASISTPTRSRGGKRLRSAAARSVFDRLHADLFVTAAELPDGLTTLFDAVGQVLHDGGWIGHCEENASAAGDPLLDAPVTHELLQVGGVFGQEVDASRRASSHGEA
jgi:hypothetical protein